VAKACGDQCFAGELCAKLLLETAELKEAQSSEPDGLVLHAIVEKVFTDEVNAQFYNIRFRDLAESIWNNHRISLTPRQVGPIARSLGFETRISHGVSVVVPTPAALLNACDECEYSDEGIETLRQLILSGQLGEVTT
jgi:hypothetical protein